MKNMKLIIFIKHQCDLAIDNKKNNYIPNIIYSIYKALNGTLEIKDEYYEFNCFHQIHLFIYIYTIFPSLLFYFYILI